LLALLHFGQPVLGVMDFPEVGEHYHAVKGGGAFLNEQPIRPRVPAMNDAGEAQILGTHLFAICSRSVKTAVPKLPSKLRISGSTGYDLALLASGVVVGLLQRRVYAWDIAAGWLLVQEAGGAVLETTGISVFPLNAILDCGERRFAICGAGSAETLGYLKKIL
jgi:myo-inositol-1(or 4)-monophosphatase